MFRSAAAALHRHRLPTLALALALGACGTAKTSDTSGALSDVTEDLTDVPSGADVNTSDNGGDLSVADGSSSDAATVETDASGEEIASDVAAGTDTADTGAGGCEFPANPLPGESGSTCKTANDCDSGACIDGPTGKICTSACSACCPTGFKCEPFTGSGGDSVQVCLPKWNALCRPCLTDAECGALGKDSLCVAYAGGTGSFCGGACGDSSDCPGDFTCQDAQGEKGAGKQCVRTKSECSCSPQATAAGAQTVCKHSNGAGTCSAARKCTLAGLEACSAPTPATETCGNATDDNCNGQTDENGASGCTPLWIDGDADGDGKLGSASQCQCAPSGLYTAISATDCDDANKAANGSAIEVCDGIDNNCDGKTDEGCDDDGDGWCDADMAVVGDPVVCKKGKKDCDDASATVNPGVPEVCGNGVDDDCDGLTDSGPNVLGCVPFYSDGDGDGYGVGDPVCECGAKGIYTATKTGDCADSDPNIHPGATEHCGNQKDDNCNGLVDEANATGCSDFYVDLDGDGFGAATPTCLCAADAGHTALKGGDCDDSALGINPAAPETCNGVDDNCNGTVDEMAAVGCTTYFVDGDGDGFGNPSTGLCLCQKTPLNTTSIGGDCNDDATTAHPGAAEICDGMDNNCDGVTDEANATGCVAYYADGDNDSWGDGAKNACLCGGNAAFKVIKLGDCDDADAAINPAAKEVCDGVDNNCVDGIDEAGAQGCSAFYRDHDGDKFGAIADSQCLCAASGEYSASQSGDCNDGDAAINPGAKEICNGKDDDCDGVKDPKDAGGCVPYFVDADTDGYGVSGVSQCQCGADGAFSATLSGDCNDGNAQVNPGKAEVCGNGVDDNCSGGTDEGCGPVCANGVAYDFNASSQGWTLGSGWGWATWLTLYGGSALTWFTAGAGYPSAPTGSSASIQLLVPNGLKTITIYATLQNVLSSYCSSYVSGVCVPAYVIDADATFAASLGANKVSIGPYATYLTQDARKQQLVINVDPAMWNTTQTLAITVTTPNASVSIQGGYAFDNVTWTCQ